MKKRGNENPFTFKLQSEATLATDMLKFPHCVIMIVSPSWGHSGGGERVGSLGVQYPVVGQIRWRGMNRHNNIESLF